MALSKVSIFPYAAFSAATLGAATATILFHNSLEVHFVRCWFTVIYEKCVLPFGGTHFV